MGRLTGLVVALWMTACDVPPQIHVSDSGQGCDAITCPGSGGGDAGRGPDGGCSCSLPNAVGSCADAGCAITSCSEGFRDADGKSANGCESSCTGLEVRASGSLDFNLQTVEVSGRVTLDGATAPIGDPRGVVRLLLAGSDVAVDLELPTSGEATYSGTVLAGIYRVSFVRSSDCRPDALPCGEQVIYAAQALDASGSLDLDVRGPPAKVTVSGQVTLSGAVLSGATTDSRGEVLFLDPKTREVVARSPLPDSGPATYSVQIPQGTYDVAVEGATDCTSLSGPLPCYRSVRKRAVAINTSGALNLDVEVVTLSGAVRLNGQRLPDGSSERARLVLRDSQLDGPPASSLGSSGPASYAALLYPETFSIDVQPSSPCPPGPLPCQSRRAVSGLAVTTTGSVDLELTAYRLAGEVTASGQTLANSLMGRSRGAVALAAGEGSEVVTALPAAGPATYEAFAYGGTYDVYLDNTLDCPEAVLPCLRYRAKAGLMLSASGGLDLDAPVAVLAGAVTVNGARLPDSPLGGARARLQFKSSTGGVAQAELPTTGAGTYALPLYPGRYQVKLSSEEEDCDSGPLPCGHRLLEPALEVSASTSKAFDVHVLELSGKVTIGGAAPASSPTGKSRGKLQFLDEESSGEAELSQSGPSTYRARLYPGTYRLLFSNSTDCPQAGAGALPCQSAVLDPSLTLTTAGSLDVDVPIATLSGRVTVNGQPMADGDDRGELRFGMWSTSGSPVIATLGAQGPATYQLKLIQGVYDVGFTNHVECGPTEVLPCQRQLLHGCKVP